MKPRISYTSKMRIDNKRVGSWSLEAGISCPASKDAEVCKSCYAKKGMYRFPVVKNVRALNREDYHTSDWVPRMITETSKAKYFRFFDSGDIETPELAEKIYAIIKATPNTKYWLPTRCDTIPRINRIINEIKTLPNVAVRLSANNIGLSKPERDGVNSYVIADTEIPQALQLGIHICPVTSSSYQKSCGTCTMCYTDKKVAYVIH